MALRFLPGTIALLVIASGCGGVAATVEACYDAIQPGDTPAIVDAKCSVPPQKEASEAGASFERIYEDSKGKARVAFTSGRVVLMTFEGKDASGKPVPGSSRAKS